MWNIVAFTGAGISAASGISTFEELGQDFRLKLSREFFNKNPDEFYKNLKFMHDSCAAAQPNPAHIALAKYNVPIITMNVDGLHHKAGSNNIVELHGHMRELFCTECGNHYKFEDVENFYCCGKPLHNYVILYGDEIPRGQEAYDALEDANELLVIGTSFYTSTSNMIVKKFLRFWPRRKITIINENAEVEVPKLLDELLGDKNASTI